MIGKKVLINLPAGMLAQLDYIGTKEHRTRSDLLREAARRYIEEFRNKRAPSRLQSLDGFDALFEQGERVANG